MANWNPPNKGEAFEIDIVLEDWLNPGKAKSNPTLAAGDFKLIKDNGAEANLATLPTVEPASGRHVRVQFSTSETNCDKMNLIWEDQTSPPEWAGGSICILTTTP